MADSSSSTSPTVVVTGANGLVGAHVCQALAARGAHVRALVRRSGTAPPVDGLQEFVGDFTDPDVAAHVMEGAAAVISTVYPMTGADLDAQQRISIAGTRGLALAAAAAGVAHHVHLSTAAVHDRSAGVGDVDESSPLVADDAGDYPVTKRRTDEELAGIEGITGVLLRPPAILGAGDSSVWNTVRPAHMQTDEAARRANPGQTFAWVHVEDLAALAADLATGAVPEAADAADGPVAGAWTPVLVVGEPATTRDYVGTVTRALEVEPIWIDDPAWTGALVPTRAHRWGWQARIGLDEALAELERGLHGHS